MKATPQNQRILNWLESEQKKDKKELEAQKRIFAEQVKKLKKEDMFRKPKKLTLWQKLKMIILGT